MACPFSCSSKMSAAYEIFSSHYLCIYNSWPRVSLQHQNIQAKGRLLFKSGNGLYRKCDAVVVSLCGSKMEMKTKVLCAKHQEDKLKLQQRHDADVQKVSNGRTD